MLALRGVLGVRTRGGAVELIEGDEGDGRDGRGRWEMEGRWKGPAGTKDVEHTCSTPPEITGPEADLGRFGPVRTGPDGFANLGHQQNPKPDLRSGSGNCPDFGPNLGPVQPGSGSDPGSGPNRGIPSHVGVTKRLTVSVRASLSSPRRLYFAPGGCSP